MDGLQKQLYLYYKGEDVNNLELVEKNYLIFWCVRKHIEQIGPNPKK